MVGGDRAADVVLPDDYSHRKEYPLVVMLHGYRVNAAINDALFGLSRRVDEYQFVLVMPEGNVDQSGAQFWNATDLCCDNDETGVDDSAYLSALIDEATGLYPTSYVALVGHSNGGFMSYRMACDHPEQLDRIAVLNASTWIDEANCPGEDPVSVLHMHGTADDRVPYEATGPYPGAHGSVARWSEKAGCDANAVTGLADHLGSPEEESEIWGWSGCDEGLDLQLWLAEGGDHLYLDANQAWRDAVAEWTTR